MEREEIERTFPVKVGVESAKSKPEPAILFQAVLREMTIFPGWVLSTNPPAALLKAVRMKTHYQIMPILVPQYHLPMLFFTT